MKGVGDDWSSESRTEWRVMWGEWVWRLCSSLHCTRAALGSPQRLSIPCGGEDINWGKGAGARTWPSSFTCPEPARRGLNPVGPGNCLGECFGWNDCLCEIQGLCSFFFPQGFCPWILRSLVSVKLSWFTSIIWVCSLYILLIIIFTVSVDFGFTFLTGSPLPWSSGHTLSIFQHSSCPTKSQKFEHSVLSRAFSLLSPFHSSCLA